MTCGHFSDIAFVSAGKRRDFCPGRVAGCSRGRLAKIKSDTLLVSLPAVGRHQGDSRLGREQSEGERLLQIQVDRSVRVTRIADGSVLPDGEFEIAAARSQYEGADNGGRPDDLIVDEPFDMLQYGVSMISSFG